LHALCIRTVQEWFIAASDKMVEFLLLTSAGYLQVLTEAAKFPDEAQQLNFVEQNRTYMLEATECFIHILTKVRVVPVVSLNDVECKLRFLTAWNRATHTHLLYRLQLPSSAIISGHSWRNAIGPM
jgi:hypothetical protein